MVSKLTADIDANSTAGSSTRGASIPARATTERQSAHGNGLRPKNSNVCKEDLSRAYIGHCESTHKDTMEQYDSASGRNGRGCSRKQTPEEFIARKRKVTVDYVMAIFEKWLEKRLAIMRYSIETAVAAEDGGGGGDTKRSPRQGSDGKESSQSSRRPKRQLQDDEDDDIAGGGDDNEQDRGGNKRAKKDPEESAKWACPFHKHNPKIHNKPICLRSWPTIHRLKEHLYRCHLLPKFSCPRCTTSFEDGKQLQAHQRADVPCKKSALIPVEGIDKDAEDELRRRKRHGSTQSEKDRWADIYLVLFPNTDRTAIPSPYADHIETVTTKKQLAQYKRMEKRVKTELPQLVREQVESKFETVEADLLRNLPDLIRVCLSNLYRGSSGDDGSSAGTRSTSRSTTPGPALTEEPGVIGNEEVDWDFSAFLGDGYGTDFGFDIDFDCTNQLSMDGSFGADKASGSDSGYASTGTVAGFHGR
ncbi:hypothetical protein GGR57DRAFT_498714 [Xylariaceae sp. FL1272]|nr:hypothetical protein GGR57DRAFT_498714 [Xylariaceae sp. FL1272]